MNIFIIAVVVKLFDLIARLFVAESIFGQTYPGYVFEKYGAPELKKGGRVQQWTGMEFSKDEINKMHNDTNKQERQGAVVDLIVACAIYYYFFRVSTRFAQILMAQGENVNGGGRGVNV